MAVLFVFCLRNHSQTKGHLDFSTKLFSLSFVSKRTFFNWNNMGIYYNQKWKHWRIRVRKKREVPGIFKDADQSKKWILTRWIHSILASLTSRFKCLRMKAFVWPNLDYTPISLLIRSIVSGWVIPKRQSKMGKSQFPNS